MHPAALEPDDLLTACDVKRTRASGPGGQHRNKVETAIVITHRPTGITAQASERRSQKQNQDVAVFRLRVNLALQVREPVGHEKPSRFRLPVNESHTDFPAVLAGALDVIAAMDDDVKTAAAFLGCSTTKLVKLLSVERRALEQVNASRIARGMHALRQP